MTIWKCTDLINIASSEYNVIRMQPKRQGDRVQTDCCRIWQFINQTLMVPDGRVICEKHEMCATVNRRQMLIDKNAGD